jgi:RNA polymerase sigma-70 factor, ECF subfamily
MTPPEPPPAGPARTSAHDDSAFEALFRAEYASLIRFAGRYVSDVAAAEDLVQDVFLTLWRDRSRLDGASSPRAYLFRAVRNRALNQLRDSRARRRIDEQLAVPGELSVAPDTGAADVARIRAALNDAVAALPARARLIFELSRYHGLTYREIAASLGISVKTVETQMGRALRVLRERLERYRG